MTIVDVRQWTHSFVELNGYFVGPRKRGIHVHREMNMWESGPRDLGFYAQTST